MSLDKQRKLFVYMAITMLLCPPASHFSRAKALQYHEYVLYPPYNGLGHGHVSTCPPDHDHIADEVDCHIFYHCQDTFWGAQMTQKTCGDMLMFNIESATCDWPYRVKFLRPECRYDEGHRRVQGLWRPASRPASPMRNQNHHPLLQEIPPMAEDSLLDTVLRWPYVKYETISASTSRRKKTKSRPRKTELHFSSMKTDPSKGGEEHSDEESKEISDKVERTDVEERSEVAGSGTSQSVKQNGEKSKIRRWKSVFPASKAKFDLGSVRVYKAKEFHKLKPSKKGKTNKFITVKVL